MYANSVMEGDYVSTSGRSPAALNVWGPVFANTNAIKATVSIAEDPIYAFTNGRKPLASNAEGRPYADIKSKNSLASSVLGTLYASMVGERKTANNVRAAMYTCARGPWPNRLAERRLTSGKKQTNQRRAPKYTMIS